MDVDTDIHLARGNTSQNKPAPGLSVAQEHETVLNADSIPDSPGSLFLDTHLDSVLNAGDVEVNEVQNSIHTFGSDEESSEIQMEINRIDYENICICPQGDSAEAVSPPGCAAVPTEEIASLASINDAEAATMISAQESPPSRAKRVSSETTPRNEKGVDPDDRLNHVQMLHLDHVHTAGPARLGDEEETREDMDYPREEFPSSLPPSSSPPQVFSSSPYASSQSSVGDVGPSKMVPAVEVEGCANSHDYASGNDVVSVTQNYSRLESEEVWTHESAELATPPDPGEYCSQMAAITSCVVDGPKLSRERDPDGSHSSRPIKRLKPDSRLYQPPAPKRVTLASQNRQFKKLAAPFRPPLKLPIATDEPKRTINNGKVELAVSAMPETRNNNDLKRSTITAQKKASNTSRSAAQFKSPLVNAVLPADSHAIRLTPALQTLERKLQVLKRAIKVKQENEEVVLTRLAGKWIEAGREAAYDVWDATKDAGEFAGKGAFIHRSHGWENSNDGNTPWGWDTKTGDASEESCDIDSSRAAGRLTPEEDDDVGRNTLGTMLHQLGIAPEILGWDDDKEAFSD